MLENPTTPSYVDESKASTDHMRYRCGPIRWLICLILVDYWDHLVTTFEYYYLFLLFPLFRTHYSSCIHCHRTANIRKHKEIGKPELKLIVRLIYYVVCGLAQVLGLRPISQILSQDQSFNGYIIIRSQLGKFVYCHCGDRRSHLIPFHYIIYLGHNAASAHLLICFVWIRNFSLTK